jgi:hypothetical protein
MIVPKRYSFSDDWSRGHTYVRTRPNASGNMIQPLTALLVPGSPYSSPRHRRRWCYGLSLRKKVFQRWLLVFSPFSFPFFPPCTGRNGTPYIYMVLPNCSTVGDETFVVKQTTAATAVIWPSEWWDVPTFFQGYLDDGIQVSDFLNRLIAPVLSYSGMR